MRLLVACPKCKRQYDATGKPVGGRFRCHCGAVLTIRQPLGHDAAVVRCSSCGAPRGDGSPACGYCGADFTLHEQDLDMVCPHCLTRVSHAAKYCHHCGVALLPEALASASTPCPCPACGKVSRLRSRQIGDLAVLECQRCAGFWLAAIVFEHLVEQVLHDPLSQGWRLPLAQRRDGACRPNGNGGPRYRKCPICGKLMTRRNYARRSGVIIDFCAQHGVWFDADELARILEWVRLGHLAEVRREESDDAKRQERLRAIERNSQLHGPFTRDLHGGDNVSVLDVVSGLAGLFR